MQKVLARQELPRQASKGSKFPLKLRMGEEISPVQPLPSFQHAISMPRFRSTPLVSVRPIAAFAVFNPAAAVPNAYARCPSVDVRMGMG
jgi:hypothetical protein